MIYFIECIKIRLRAKEDAKSMVEQKGKFALVLSQSYLDSAIELECNTRYWKALRDNIKTIKYGKEKSINNPQ